MTAHHTFARLAAADPHALLDRFVAKVEGDHDMAFERSADGARFLESGGFRISLAASDAGLLFDLSGPEPGMISFFKEEIARHLAGLDGTLAESLRWSGETARSGALPSNFRVLRVARRSQPLEHLVRLTMQVTGQGFFERAGLHLRLMLPAEPGRAPSWPTMAANGAPAWPKGADRLHARYVTLRSARPAEREVDLDIVSHGDGLISNWASVAQPGEEIGAMGPLGMLPKAPAERLFLAADLTGLPGLARLLEATGPDTRGHLISETASADALSAYLPQSRIEVHAVDRAAFAETVLPMAQRLARPGETDFALFAGEFEAAQSMRRFFGDELALGKGAQISAAYWRRGEAGFDG